MVRNQSCPSNTNFIHAIHDTFYASPTNVKGQTETKVEKREEKVVKREDKVEHAQDYIEKTAKEYGIDHKLVRAIIQVESRGQADLIGDNGESYGLCQIQPKWHSHRLREGESLLDPKVNVRVACEILSELMERYDTLDEVLTAYNAGHDTGSREYANRVYEEMK